VSLVPKPVPLPNKHWRVPSKVECAWSHGLSITTVTFTQRLSDPPETALLSASQVAHKSALTLQVETLLKRFSDTGDGEGENPEEEGDGTTPQMARTAPPAFDHTTAIMASSVEPGKLKTMSSDQLRLLIKHMSGSGEGPFDMEALQAEKGLTQGERDMWFMTRTFSTTSDPSLRAREKGWNRKRVERKGKKPASNTAAAALGRTMASEATMRTEILRLDTEGSSPSPTARRGSGARLTRTFSGECGARTEDWLYIKGFAEGQGSPGAHGKSGCQLRPLVMLATSAGWDDWRLVILDIAHRSCDELGLITGADPCLPLSAAMDESLSPSRAQAKAEEEAKRAAALEEWRAEREGDVSSTAILRLFSPAHLITASNPSASVRSIRQVASEQGAGS
jgi:hypothetical protein